jgi:hypothetical protein
LAITYDKILEKSRIVFVFANALEWFGAVEFAHQSTIIFLSAASSSLSFVNEER